MCGDEPVEARAFERQSRIISCFFRAKWQWRYHAEEPIGGIAVFLSSLFEAAHDFSIGYDRRDDFARGALLHPLANDQRMTIKHIDANVRVEQKERVSHA